MAPVSVIPYFYENKVGHKNGSVDQENMAADTKQKYSYSIGQEDMSASDRIETTMTQAKGCFILCVCVLQKAGHDLADKTWWL